MPATTNKPLADWGRVLHDAALAEAILERGRHLELRGRSYRTRHAPLDLTPASEPPSPGPARISGNHRPEFSEPTRNHCPVRLTVAFTGRERASRMSGPVQRGVRRPRDYQVVASALLARDEAPEQDSSPRTASTLANILSQVASS